MRKIYLLAASLLVFSILHSQEICNNGIDDDSDGLIDLNDVTDCTCGSTSITSLIPNPSFETMNCCPSTFSQMNCAGTWIQASSATSDYMNTCGMVFTAATNAGLVPFPDGNGIVGTIFSPGWQEYVGACLSSPLVAGTPYTIQMNIASTPIDNYGDVCNGGIIDFGPIDVVIYGTTSCANLPFAGTGCPPSPAWQVLGQANYTPIPSWGLINISFTPPVNITGIIIGSPCTLPASYSPPSGCYPYFYYDNLLLNTTASFSGITAAGSWCANNFQLLSTTSPGATYQWYLDGVALVGQTDTTLNISANSFGSGNYSCVVTVGLNCSVSSYSVLSQSAPTADFNFTTACFGTTPTFFTDSSYVTSGTITAWSWDFGDPPSGVNNTSSLQNPNHLFTSTGTFNVTLISTSNNGCQDTIVIPITVNPVPIADAGVNQSICSGNPVSLNATGGGTYIWNGGTLVNASGASQTDTPSTTTSYIVTVTNSFGCTDNDTIDVTVNQTPIFTAGNDISLCAGDTAQLNASGTGTFLWTPSTGLSNPNISNPLANPSATTTYTTTLTDANGCVGTDNITITVNPVPVAVASNDTSVCGGVNINLTASGGTTYTWNGGTLVNANGASQIVAPNSTTTYTVTVTANGCSDIEIVVVTVNSPIATASQDATICLGESTTLNATGGISYSWLPTSGLSNPNIANPIASPTITTTYTVTTTNSIGCTASDVVTITVAPTPISAFTYMPTIILADSTYYFTDQSTGSVNSWLWNFGDGGTSTQQNPSHFYPYAGTYHVCLITTSNAGCVDTICWDLEVLPRPLEAPNVFTPNGDGTNDFLEFKNLEFYPNSLLKVYDRWGVLVFENGNYLNDWNGKKLGTGADCVDGTYYYILSGSLIKEPMTGFVTLIRGK